MDTSPSLESRNLAEGSLSRWPAAVIGALVVLFWLSLAPYAGNFVLHHPDERHYTDAAISMLDSGDYLSPRSPDGSFRFRKPVLTYWCVAASYRLWGISPFTSRLPFLAAGGLIVWLTYRLAATVCRDRGTAILAALIIMCHPMLIGSSTRSIPDVLLCLLLLGSACGFVQLIVAERVHRGAYWVAYVGCGLAVACKGMPAIAFLAFSWAFALSNPWRPMCWRKLVHIPSMLAGLLLAFGWFAVVYVLHGHSALAVFWVDQVRHRVTDSHWKPIYQLPLFVVLSALCFVPWVLPLVGLSRRAWARTQTGEGGPPVAVRYILLWTLTYSIFAALVTKFSTRYLLPVAPLLAVWLAITLAGLDAGVLRRWLRVLLGLASVWLLLLGAVAILASVQLGTGRLDIAICLALLVAGAALVICGMRGTRLMAAVCLTMALYLGYPLGFLSLRHLVLPDQGAQLAQRLGQLAAAEGKPVHLVGKPSLASKIRVCSAGKARLSQSDQWDARQLAGETIVIHSEQNRPQADACGYEVYLGSHGIKDLAWDRIVVSLIHGDLAEYLRQRRETYLIAVSPRVELPVRVADRASNQMR